MKRSKSVQLFIFFSLYFSYLTNNVTTYIFKEGHTVEFYTNHDQSEKVLSHKQLLRDYGADESLADDMLIDQGKNI